MVSRIKHEMSQEDQILVDIRSGNKFEANKEFLTKMSSKELYRAGFRAGYMYTLDRLNALPKDQRTRER